jgi:hypothetical protein
MANRYDPVPDVGTAANDLDYFSFVVELREDRGDNPHRLLLRERIIHVLGWCIPPLFETQLE